MVAMLYNGGLQSRDIKQDLEREVNTFSKLRS